MESAPSQQNENHQPTLPRIRVRLAGVLERHHRSPRRLQFSRDGRLLFSVGEEDGESTPPEVGIWNIERQTAIRLGVCPGYYPLLAPDGQSIVFCMEDGHVVRADLEDRPIGDLTGEIEIQPILGIAISPDETTVVAADGLGNIELWDTRTRARLALLRVQEEETRFPYSEVMGFSPDGRWLLVDAPDGRGAAHLLSLSRSEDVGALTGAWVAAFGSANANPEGFAFAPRGRLLALATARDPGILLARLPGLERGHLSSLANRILDTSRALAFSPDSLWLAEGTTSQGRVALWDVLTGRLALTWEAHTDYYHALGSDQIPALFDLAWSPGGRWITTAGWSVQPGNPKARYYRDRWRETPVIKLWEVEREPPWETVIPPATSLAPQPE